MNEREIGTNEHGDVVLANPELLLEAVVSAIRSRKLAIELAIRDRDNAYRERNAVLVALASAVVLFPGWTVGRAIDPTAEPGWENLLVIIGPKGQMAWHFGEADLSLLTENFELLEGYEWDKHTTVEKYYRLGDSSRLLRKLGESG